MRLILAVLLLCLGVVSALPDGGFFTRFNLFAQSQLPTPPLAPSQPPKDADFLEHQRWARLAVGSVVAGVVTLVLTVKAFKHLAAGVYFLLQVWLCIFLWKIIEYPLLTSGYVISAFDIFSWARSISSMAHHAYALLFG